MNKKQAIALSVAGTLALALAMLLLAATSAQAKPDATLPAAPAAQADVVSSTISYQGRLLDSSGNPVDGAQVMAFRVYTQPVAGTSLWSQTRSISVDEGLFTVHLDVEPALFDGQALWLGVQVAGDAQEMLPRQPLLPAPYAFHAFTTRWAGLMDVPPGLQDGDDDTTYVPGPGLALTGNTFSISTTYRLPQGCGGDQVAKWDAVGDSWYCTDDDDTTYIPGLGLILTDDAFEISTTYRLPQSCGDGQIAEWDANASTWYCGSDDVGGGSSAWLLGGNAGTAYDADFLGTTDAVSLTLIADSSVALRLEPTGGTPNLLGGIEANWTTAGVSGATIGGGGSGGSGANRVTDDYGTVSGGAANRAGDADSFTTDATYATVGGGYLNVATANQATVGGGGNNHASGRDSTVGGGEDNYATAIASTIGGGTNHFATGQYATISGGSNHSASGQYAAVSGGSYNTASGYGATVGGGITNTATLTGATIGGGESNAISATHGTIAGGRNGTVTGDYASISGGWDNTAAGELATVGGGRYNTAGGNLATVSGGDSNAASGDLATVGGGYNNTAGGWHATVAGGYSNEASGPYTTVPGGVYNVASGAWTTIGGGGDNLVTATYGTIGGGYNGIVTGNYATVGGGWYNTASGSDATVPGGHSNIASGDYSFAAGNQAHATHPGSFVWSSYENTASWGDDTFTARAHGGARFYSASGTGMGVQLSSGGTSWGSISDRNAKENFDTVDTERLLETLASMPIQTWNLKAQSPDMRHVGPVAQDFNGEFGYLFGDVESPVHINTMDAVGVSLAAAQGLYERSQEQAAQIEGLETENAALRQQVSGLESRLATLEATANSTTPGWSLQGSLLPGASLFLASLSVAIVLWKREMRGNLRISRKETARCRPQDIG